MNSALYSKQAKWLVFLYGFVLSCQLILVHTYIHALCARKTCEGLFIDPSISSLVLDVKPKNRGPKEIKVSKLKVLQMQGRYL